MELSWSSCLLYTNVLCVLDALLKLLESYYGILRWFKSIGMSFMSLFKNKKIKKNYFLFFRGRELSRPLAWFYGRDGVRARWRPLNQKAWKWLDDVYYYDLACTYVWEWEGVVKTLWVWPPEQNWGSQNPTNYTFSESTWIILNTRPFVSALCTNAYPWNLHLKISVLIDKSSPERR
jgi:hypothetical protein